jgi:hypothetical protein
MYATDTKKLQVFSTCEQIDYAISLTNTLYGSSTNLVYYLAETLLTIGRYCEIRYCHCMEIGMVVLGMKVTFILMVGPPILDDKRQIKQ